MNELFLPSGTHKEEKTASSLLVAALCDENLIGYRIACPFFSLSRQGSLSFIKRSKAHGAESSINTDEHDAGHSINETADHFIKHICFPFLDAFFG